MRLCIGFIIYNPPHTFMDRMESLSKEGIAIYILDNSSRSGSLVNLSHSIKYYNPGSNLGLGKGLLLLGQNAAEDLYDYFVYFDQDTVITRSTIDFIKSFIINQADRYKSQYVVINFSDKPGNTDHVVDTPLVVNSGSLFFLENLKKIGWHSPELHVEGVDYEICLRSALYGFKVGMINATPGLDHQSEQPTTSINLFGRRISCRSYSSERNNEIIKSYAYLIRQSVRNNQLVCMCLLIRSSLITFIFLIRAKAFHLLSGSKNEY